jgi:hypothetical protein
MLGLVRMISCYEAYNIDDTMHAALPERILRSRGLLQLVFPARLFLELRLRNSLFRPKIPQPQRREFHFYNVIVSVQVCLKRSSIISIKQVHCTSTSVQSASFHPLLFPYTQHIYSQPDIPLRNLQ